MADYWVYLLANKPRSTLYVGVTNDLVRWIFEPHFQPERRQPRLAAAERNRPAHLDPLLARGALDRRIVAHARLQCGKLVADDGIEHRLDLVAEVHPDACNIGPRTPKSRRPVRFGSIRQADVSCGRDVTSTLLWKSV